MTGSADGRPSPATRELAGILQTTTVARARRHVGLAVAAFAGPHTASFVMGSRSAEADEPVA